MNAKTKKLVFSSLVAALVCVATMVIKIPSPLQGYLNLGDGVVLLAGWLLSPSYAFLAAGLGSALADLLSGYAVYAVATFLIKGCMALLCGFLFQRLNNKLRPLPLRIISGMAAEGEMVLGYFLFEGVLYGFAPSLVNVIPNALQGVAGLVLGSLLVVLFEKTNVSLK